MPTVQAHIEWLQRSYEQSDVIACPIWTVEDVLEQAKERDMKITKKQAEEVLDRIDRKHNAELGITWTTIDCELDDLED